MRKQRLAGMLTRLLCRGVILHPWCRAYGSDEYEQLASIFSLMANWRSAHQTESSLAIRRTLGSGRGQRDPPAA